MRVVLLVLCVWVLGADRLQAIELAKRPFTVADSIEMTRILIFATGPAINPPTGTALFSPDRSQFVLHTRRGDLASDVIVEFLLAFKTGDIEQYLGYPESMNKPPPRILLQKSITDDWGGMSKIQWLNDKEVGFVAQDDNGTRQAFCVDVARGDVTQLTHSETPVESFTADINVVLFYAHLPLSQDQVSVIGKKSIYDVVIPDSSTDTPIRMFRTSRSKGDLLLIDAPAMRLAPDANRV